MGSGTRWLRRLCLSATLIVANLAFFGIASWLLVAGSAVRKAGWIDVFEDDFPWFHWVYVLLVVLLSALVGVMALTGVFNVLCRRRQVVIWIYAVCAVLTTLLVLFLTVVGIVSWSTAGSWRSRPTMNPAIESNAASEFNAVYCVAQAGFLCTAPSSAQWLVHFGAGDLRDIFLNDRVAATVKKAMAADRATRGQSLLELCEDETSPLHIPVMSPAVAELCTWCGGVADVKSYVHLVAWANTKCSPTPEIAAYCADTQWRNITDKLVDTSASLGRPDAFAMVDALTNDVSATPYGHCRRPFLNYWTSLSAWFTLLSAGMALAMALVLRVSWLVMRRKDKYTDHVTGKRPERRPLVNTTDRTNRQP
ncbi:hypothetical protein ATCC90586_001183 [Pythium insidiosum]|nr:hypothetical protein ATCC90586_001183 [Pythium insidiosum]